MNSYVPHRELVKWQRLASAPACRRAAIAQAGRPASWAGGPYLRQGASAGRPAYLIRAGPCACLPEGSPRAGRQARKPTARPNTGSCPAQVCWREYRDLTKFESVDFISLPLKRQLSLLLPMNSCVPHRELVRWQRLVSALPPGPCLR